MQENRALLLARFVKRLRTLAPGACLDVGCGGGELLAAARSDGRPGTGIESAPTRLRAARARNLAVVQASAAALPWRDASVPWVILRHVLHHLPSPAVALREAWRVAQLGLLLAEPWNDPQLATQRAMTRVDAWLRSAQRRRGERHDDNLTAKAILNALAARPERIEIEHYTPLRPLRLDDLHTEMQRAAPGARSPAEESTFSELEALAADGAVTLPGTVIVTCWKS